MKHKLSVGLLCLLSVVFLVYSCRNDYLKDQAEPHYNPVASQLKVVKLSEIPKVTKYIKTKTGRTDLKVPLKNSSFAAKGEIDFADLQSSLILQKTEDSLVYYIFNIINAGDERTVYTFEVKEVEEEIVRAEVIEYKSQGTMMEDPIRAYYNFTGRVTSYDVDGASTSFVDYLDGGNNCPPPPSNGNPSGGGSYPGGGSSPGIVVPPSVSYPSNPGYPSWPSYPSHPPSGGGGSSGGGNDNPVIPNCTSTSWELVEVLALDGDGNGVGLYISNCGYTAVKSFSIDNNIITTYRLITPRCNEGSGVVVLPVDPIKFNDPCKKTKTMLENPNVQEGIEDVKEQAKDAYDDGNIGEIGFREMNDGTTVPGTPSADGHGVDYGDKTNSKGGYHNHTALGIDMFSPKDINELLGFVKAQPTGGGNYTGDAYHGMISVVGCDCPPENKRIVHYVIRFNGTYQQAVDYIFDNNSERKFRKDYIDSYNDLTEDSTLLNPNPYIDNHGYITNEGLEKLFFDMLKGMNFDRNHFVLQRIEEDGSINTITPDNENNTSTTATPCP